MVVLISIVDTLSAKYDNVEVAVRKGRAPGWYSFHITASLGADAYGTATEFSEFMTPVEWEDLILEAAETLDRHLRRRNGTIQT